MDLSIVFPDFFNGVHVFSCMFIDFPQFSWVSMYIFIYSTIFMHVHGFVHCFLLLLLICSMLFMHVVCFFHSWFSLGFIVFSMVFVYFHQLFPFFSVFPFLFFFLKESK